jgi:hypothetical protein
LATAQNGKMSNTAIITVTGIDDITSDAMIIGTKGAIVIKGFENKEVTVYAADGKTVVSDMITKATTVLTMEPGVYVVKVGTTSAKVLVK